MPANAAVSPERRVESIMETPAEVEFQGMRSAESLRTEITKYIAGLEDRFGRVTACRVVLKGPGEHHRTSGLYEVNIRVALPGGRGVEVSRTPKADERHADVHFAIHDAFKRARRQLQDQARRLDVR
jgi:ribosome-associated translation inhibitor RaiA